MTVSPPPGAPPALSETDAAGLSATLWRERELLDDLLFRLTEQQLVLAAGGVRWLRRLDTDVSRASQTLQDFEVVRAIEVDDLARRAGLDGDTSLTALAAAFPTPWPQLLVEHADELRTRLLEIEAASAENQRLLRAGEQATRDVLDQVVGAPGDTTGDFGPAARRFATAPHLLDTRA